MEIDHLLQDLNGFGASLEFNVADTDIPQIVEPSAISNSLCVQQQDKDEERRKEALAIPGADQGEGTRLVAQLEHAKSHPRATGAYSHLVGEACLGTG